MLVAATFLASGCVAYKPKPLDPVRSLGDLENRALNDAGLNKFIAANVSKMGASGTGWGLGRLTLAALYFHPDLDVARTEQALVEAGAITAKEKPNPVLLLLPGFDTSARGVTPWLPMVSLDVPIETAGKRSIRKEAALRKAQSARWKLAGAAWTVRGHLRKAMVALHYAQQSETLLATQEQLQSESSRLLEEQRKAGESSPFLATAARIALSQTQLTLRDAQRKVASTRAQLAETIGVSTHALDGTSLDFSELNHASANITSSKARKAALLNRADILGALAEYAITEAALHLEIAKQYPDIHLGPGYQLDQTDNKWTVGITLELPLNRNRGKIAEASAEREAAAAKFRQVQAKALAEIEQAIINYRGAQDKAVTVRKLLDDLQKQVKSAEQMKQAGEIGRVELTQRQLEANTIALALLEAESGVKDALSELESALQVPATLPESAWSIKLR